MLDGQPTGQDFDVKFAFKPQLSATFKGPVEVNGNTLDYKRELEKGESAAGDIAGFSDKVVDNDIRVEDRKTGAGVRETGDHPLSRLYFWSIRTTVCPEAYIHMHIEPKREFKWRIAYTFYRVNGASSGEQTGTTRVKALRKTAR